MTIKSHQATPAEILQRRPVSQSGKQMMNRDRQNQHQQILD